MKFALAFGIVSALILSFGAETAGKILVVVFLALCIFGGLLTSRYEPQDSEEDGACSAKQRSAPG